MKSSLMFAVMMFSWLSFWIANGKTVMHDGSRDLPAGLVVTKVRSNSEAARAGFQEGDVILTWRRGEAGGNIESPFVLWQIQAEQKPLGAITLEGFHGSEKTSWVMGFGFWDLHVRPNLPENALRLYKAARQQGDHATISDVEKLWKAAATEMGMYRSSWLVSWILSQAAAEIAEKREWTVADKLYGEAIEAASHNPNAAAIVLHRWGESFEERSDWQNAERLYQRSLEIVREQGPDSLGVAAALNTLGDLALRRGELEQAETFHAAALPISSRLVPGSLIVAKSFNKLGSDAFLRGNLPQSEEFQRQALAIQERLDPGGMEMAGSLAALGHIALKRDDLVTAEDDFRQSLAIQEKLAPDTLDIASLLDNLGGLAFEQGDLVKAEKYHHKALQIEERHDHDGLYLANTLTSLGSVVRNRGDFDDAERYELRALSIREKLAPQSLSVATSLDHLGALALIQEKTTAAEGYLRQSLKIREDLAPNSLDVAATLNNLGYLYRQRGASDRAEEYHRRALAIAEQLAPSSLFEAESRKALGDLASDRKQLNNAEAYYRQELAIREKLAPGSAEHAESLASLATILRQQGQASVAAQFFEQALSILESQSFRLGGTEESRSIFRARHESCYTRYMDLLLDEQRPEIAFQVWERFRARSLVEMLTEAHIDIRKGADPELLQQEQLLHRTLEAKSVGRIRLFNSKHSAEAISEVNREIAKLLERYNQVEQQIRDTSPSYAALTQPRALSAKEIQQQLLDPDTLLLEYSLGEDHSYVWAVTASSFEVHELPSRAAVEKSASHVYDLLTARNRSFQNEGRHQQQDRIARADAEYYNAAAALSAMILGPVAGQLKDKRLLIVSDGTLQYIPFSVLPDPAPPSSARDEEYPLRTLLAKHEIVSLPSASVLAVLRGERVSRTRGGSEVAVVADPVFDKDDLRVKAGIGRGRHGISKEPLPASALLPAQQLTRSAKDVGLNPKGDFHLARLPFTREEARTILAQVSPGRSMQALDFRASRETVISGALADYRFVHIATHALMDNQHPELSGLVLSLVDERGEPVNGFLELQDIYNLDLLADLVVLSSCSTGLGKEIQGEGIIGLTRGFMYAGASRVMSSLWEIDDVATSKLMGAFYKAILRDGIRPSAALRKAQLDMQKQKHWSAPYYWAGFQLQGEWK